MAEGGNTSSRLRREGAHEARDLHNGGKFGKQAEQTRRGNKARALSLNSEVELSKESFIDLLHCPIFSVFNFGEVDSWNDNLLSQKEKW